MNTTRSARSRWLSATLTVLGGTLALAACGTPVSPTALPTDPAAVAAAVDDAGGVRKSAVAKPNFTCRPPCAVSEIDPLRPPPNKDFSFTASVSNTGGDPAGNLHVAVSLLGSGGRLRIPVSAIDLASPRPGETVSFRLRFTVPAGVPAGRYAIQVVLDPRNEIAESDEADNVWVSEDSLVVGL
jgi:hypothetical protein